MPGAIYRIPGPLSPLLLMQTLDRVDGHVT